MRPSSDGQYALSVRTSRSSVAALYLAHCSVTPWLSIIVFILRIGQPGGGWITRRETVPLRGKFAKCCLYTSVFIRITFIGLYVVQFRLIVYACIILLLLYYYQNLSQTVFVNTKPVQRSPQIFAAQSHHHGLLLWTPLREFRRNPSPGPPDSTPAFSFLLMDIQ